MKTYFKAAFILLMVFNFSFVQVQGQDTLKSFNNKWATELNFNPFNGNLSFNNAMGQIKLRHFNPDNSAFRFSVNLSFNQNNSNSKTVYGTNPYENEVLQKAFQIGFNVGKEKHFAGTKRLSPYIGWETGLGYKSTYQKTKTDTKTTEVKGAWITYNQVQNSQYQTSYYTSYGERGFWSIGANLVTGFDFYMSEKFYFGYELMFGLDYINYSDIDITEKYSSGSGSGSSGQNFPDLDEESWKFGPKLLNGIRIGFVF